MDTNSFLLTRLLAVWQRRWIIVLVAWVICVIGWPLVMSLPEQYTSAALVYVDTNSLVRPLMKDLTVQSDPSRDVEVVRQTLASRPNLEEVAQRTKLDHGARTELDRAKVVGKLEKNLIVRSEPNSLYRISYDNTDPVLAHSVVSELLQLFLDKNIGNSREDFSTSLRFITEQISEYEQKMSEAERRLSSFQEEHAEELAQQSNALKRLEETQANLRQLQTELDSAIWRRDQLRSQLASIPRTLSRQAGDTGPDPALLARLNELLLRYTDQHPEVVAMKRLIEQSQQGRTTTTVSSPNPVYQQLEAELKALDGQISSAEFRIPQVLAQLDEERRLAEHAPSIQLQLTQMNRDYDILRQNYLTLLERREAANLTQRMTNETDSIRFRVIESPIVPVSPSGVPRALLIAGVPAIGLGAGLGLALLPVLLGSMVLTIRDLRTRFDFPVLGSVSQVRRSPVARFADWTGLTAAVALLVAVCLYLISGDLQLEGLRSQAMIEGLLDQI